MTDLKILREMAARSRSAPVEVFAFRGTVDALVAAMRSAGFSAPPAVPADAGCNAMLVDPAGLEIARLEIPGMPAMAVMGPPDAIRRLKGGELMGLLSMIFKQEELMCGYRIGGES